MVSLVISMLSDCPTPNAMLATNCYACGNPYVQVDYRLRENVTLVLSGKFTAAWNSHET